MLRRPCFLLVLLIAAASTSAQAQIGPGTIYYGVGSEQTDVYRVRGDGTANVKLPFAYKVNVVTWLNIYPGGHQFFGTTNIQGPIPGTNKNYGQIVLLAEQTGVQTTVTDFGGPQYVDQNGPRHRVSNDQQDSFFSFVVWDTRDASYHLVRYNGPISDLFQPGFVPFTSGDPRLFDLTNTPTSQMWSWDPTGRRLTYTLLDAKGRNQIWIYDAATNTSTKANDPAVSGLDLTTPWCSSTEFRLFGPATHANGTKGIVSFYPATGQWNWVVKEGGGGTKKISSFSSVAISPDGTTLAFGLLRIVNKETVSSLVRLPANGGSYTPLATFTSSNTNTIDAGRLGWKW